jgi:hypothetical protein
LFRPVACSCKYVVVVVVVVVGGGGGGGGGGISLQGITCKLSRPVDYFGVKFVGSSLKISHRHHVCKC